MPHISPEIALSISLVTFVGLALLAILTIPQPTPANAFVLGRRNAIGAPPNVNPPPQPGPPERASPPGPNVNLPPPPQPGPRKRASTLKPLSQPKNVEFSVFAPRAVSLEEPFRIDVHMSFFKSDGNVSSQQPSEFQTLVEALRKGSVIALSLESKWLQIDAPYQRLHWEEDPLTAVFVVRLSKLASPPKYNCAVYISIDGYPMGHIPFELQVKRRNSKALPKALGERFHPAELAQYIGKHEMEGHGKGALRYRDVFLSHAAEDLDAVNRIASSLELGGVSKIRMHQTRSAPGPASWTKSIEHEIDLSDSFLLCWSKHAANSDPIRHEIDYALQREARDPSFKLIPIQIGDTFVALPSDIEERMATSMYFFMRGAETASNTA